MRKGSFDVNQQQRHLQQGGTPITLPQPTMKNVQQAYSAGNKQVSPFNADDLPHLNNWVQYRLFDKYLTTLIAAMNEQLDLPEETKEAFVFNAERTTASLYELDEWVYLGAQMVEEMDELSFAEQIEMLKHAGYEKSKNMKQQIVGSRMIETLKTKHDDFDKMYKQIVEKAIIVIDLLEAYELSLDELKIDETGVQFNGIIKAMQIAYLEIEAGDRLELEKCITIDVCETEDIAKEFLIKKVVQRGITLKGELHRKASVIVYRWEEELDD